MSSKPLLPGHPMVPSPLYDPAFEHDACGVGFIANLHGERSYDILDRAVIGLKNLAHRGAIDADAVTGDGAGVLTQIPHLLLREYLEARGKKLYRDEDLCVCMLFLPRDDEYEQAQGRKLVEESAKAEGLGFLAWREVPVDPTCLGKKALLTRPLILQGLFARTQDITQEQLERRCFLASKAAIRRAEGDRLKDFYITSFSCRTVTYKGLLNAPQVRRFYLDLKSHQFRTAFALFHQRFATNTFPDWAKAQPFRMMAHNGEINTIRGNRNLMRAREHSPRHGIWGDRYPDLKPIMEPDGSDSASFDNAFQLITVAGRTCLHTISMMMPSAWEKDESLRPAVRDFYRYHSTVIEPWDGPAAIVYTDGRYVGASLDRNGLRPLRYKVYEDGTVVAASEVGLIPEWGSPVKQSGRLGPGKMIAVDTVGQCILQDSDIKDFLAGYEDYERWCDESLVDLRAQAAPSARHDDYFLSGEQRQALQVAHHYDPEERETILKPMATTGMEAVGSMGDDTPLAVLSRRPKLLYNYFRQLFAQVTNPAIDPIRENLVMSLNMYLGGRVGLFEGIEHHNDYYELPSPILAEHEFQLVRKGDAINGAVLELDATWEASEGAAGLEPRLRHLAQAARKGVAVDNIRLVIVSDRNVTADRAAIPMLAAVGAVHQELVRAGVRLKADVLADTAEARDVHQMACLLGFGANAINPFLAQEVLRELREEALLPPEIDAETALDNYRKALDKGLLKIMSKMGISTLFSYQGAQIFEAIGLGKKLMDECFFGTPSPIGGLSYEQLAEETLRRHRRAFALGGPARTREEGYYRVKKKGDGEYHGWSPKVVAGMTRFVNSSDYGHYEEFEHASNDHAPVSIKDLLRFRFAAKPLELDQVEAIEDIRQRFTTAAMSLGALSPEAHETLAIAMNRIGGKSNSGEGGEDPRRFEPFENGDLANSAIKQVASGRFGVTAEYLANAQEIEIKIAQGAKPGEGGQLPGHKVSPLIARLRYSVPGVTLISPPPHHDIYSIEDLAQLIFDLKEVNPRAKVCVKLVSSAGVGTVAAGVAKAYADVILISGHDGGTGASPMSSIKYAGSPWEIGLAEAHQVLMMNDLRSRVTLRTDGGMKTGRDIVVAAILGAEEYNFGTAALIAAGCAMFRVCHLNSCPVGVATQREDLRAKFRGKPENVVTFFNAVAEDVRRLLAKLGHRRLDDIIGRTDLLEQIDDAANPKSKSLNLGGILHNPDPTGDADRIHTRPRNDRFGNEGSLDNQILQAAHHVIRHKTPVFNGRYRVTNVDRNVGTHLSGEIAYVHGNKGLKPGTLDLTFTGSAGQSFGCFLVQGIRLELFGEANDYVGKGMNGGEIIVRPRKQESYVWHENIIMGNTCLYGATGGYLFGAGQAGERFGVRNSGATAVIEGLGDHGCEYMTGGTIVVLGPVGRNFGAGMSGGLAFIYDDDETFASRYNPEMIGFEELAEGEEAEDLRRLIALHLEVTTSPRAQEILDDWEQARTRFKRVVPHPSTPEAPKAVFRFAPPVEAVAS